MKTYLVTSYYDETVRIIHRIKADSTEEATDKVERGEGEEVSTRTIDSTQLSDMTEAEEEL